MTLLYHWTVILKHQVLKVMQNFWYPPSDLRLKVPGFTGSNTCINLGLRAYLTKAAGGSREYNSTYGNHSRNVFSGSSNGPRVLVG